MFQMKQSGRCTDRPVNNVTCIFIINFKMKMKMYVSNIIDQTNGTPLNAFSKIEVYSVSDCNEDISDSECPNEYSLYSVSFSLGILVRVCVSISISSRHYSTIHSFRLFSLCKKPTRLKKLFSPSLRTRKD